MSVAETSISWCDATWNILRGCSRVSTGCEHCYAEAQAGRFSGPGQPYEGLVRKTTNGFRWTGKVQLIEKDLMIPLRWKKPRRIFVNSMSDLFHEDVPDDWIDQIFAIMLQAEHTFQILTKRPERMARYVTRWLAPALTPQMLEHIWLGVSVENQATAEARIPWLLKTPAIVRFISYEPALGPLDLYRGGWNWLERLRRPTGGYTEKLNWVIVGGESGPKARPCDVHWLCDVAKQCQSWGVPCWMKQDTSRRSGQQGRIPDEVWAMKQLPQGL